MTRKQILVAACTAFALPQIALAYLSPEQVLLNKDMYLPPEPRESQDRSDLQAQETAARRAREQEAAFALQHPASSSEASSAADDGLHGAAPGWPAGFVAVPIQIGGSTIPMMQMMGAAAPTQSSLDVNANLELLRTMRLVSRVNQNQAIDGEDMMHSSAKKPLASSGPGAILSAMTMVGSVFWTLRRAGKAGKASV